MERQKRWQLFLILAVVILTIYNILPTVFYYSKPLKKPIEAKEAEKVAHDIIQRVNDLEPFTLSWIKAQSKNLGLHLQKITFDPEDARLVTVKFKNPDEAAFFTKTLNRAGNLIPFVPAQLNPYPSNSDEVAIVQRKVGIHLDPSEQNSYFQYVPKQTPNGSVSPEYQKLIDERALEIALGFGGESEPAKFLMNKTKGTEKEERDTLIRLARTILSYENSFGEESSITKRYFASFTQTAQSSSSPEQLVQELINRLEKAQLQLASQISSVQQEERSSKERGEFLDSVKQQQLEVLENQKNTLQAATIIVRRNAQAFQKGEKPLNRESVIKLLTQNKMADERMQIIPIGNRNPFVDKVAIDWNKDVIEILLHPDVISIRSAPIATEKNAFQLEKLNQLLFNEIAMVARTADETIHPTLASFNIVLNKLTNSSSLLTLDLGSLADEEIQNVKKDLTTSWNPQGELAPSKYPLLDWSQYQKLPLQDKKFGLVFYAPVQDSQTHEGFRNSSLYVIARGAGAMLNKYQQVSSGKEKEFFEKDFRHLQEILKQNGFIGYPGSASALSSEFRNDYIFELDDYYSYLLAATREDFFVKGDKRHAILEFTDVEQRILTLNKIETQIHEDLLKWRDEYQAARVNINPAARYDVPPPTQSPFWSNLKLSASKYLRGDNRKILKWGLDLSGGRTVRIGLRDQNNHEISNEDDLRQAVNELYSRVNRLGLSEVGIRIEGSTIVLDFPGSQGLSGSDLIQASAMFFHVVNEKFSSHNPMLSEAVDAFLEEVWNEAVITNRTDPESINEIAWQHLGGNLERPEEFHPLTSHAQLLYEHGLRLTGPKSPPRSSNFDDTLSAISRFRGSSFTDWQGQTYPLLIVFRNYTLEGANLTDVQTGYDPSEGNILYFGVKGSYTTRDGQKVHPRDDFYAWTSQFSEEKIIGTPKETYSQGKGWRMAVILNGSAVSAPSLTSPLRDRARISGHFSQREINQLAADLKAGSLSFTPYILSEENISPDLGKEQRTQGILASVIGLLLVIGAMCAYYRFGGVVASVAVIFNLLILWAVLQNLGAALTLPSIAGIILAMGMAVDANVLVFERIREEFAISKRLPSAIQTGYRKAFSAIVDSNLTTIIAALILLNFDSGPIKGFALTLIIGIVSSMFTALFMTRYFFAGWVQNPKHKELKMARFFGETKINFLSRARYAFTITALIVVIGLGVFATERKTIFGMDFTGGYAITLDLMEKPNTNYRLEAAQALVASGASPTDFQIRELSKPTQLRIQLGTGMEQQGKPFYEIDQASTSASKGLFRYQDNPRIVWIVNALEKKGLEINPSALPNLDLNWTEMSGQLSDTMRNQALIGLGLALLCILIYITFRFEFKYAISAVLGLAHDILVTLAILALLHKLWEGIQIDLQVVAALMTIIGYSLNDTIIIFDRIREETRLLRKMRYYDIVNHALNATLSRTVMTSGTTLLVLLALVFIGGPSIFNFALVMTLGVAIGTLSSLFIAAPVLLFFHNKEVSKEEQTSAKNA